MAEPVVVEIMGHKATVQWIKGQKPDAIIRNDYALSVWVDFDEPVDGTSGFAFLIPIKNYGKEELIRVIESEGEKALQQSLDNHRKMLEKMNQEKARTKDLDDFGANLMKILGK